MKKIIAPLCFSGLFFVLTVVVVDAKVDTQNNEEVKFSEVHNQANKASCEYSKVIGNSDFEPTVHALYQLMSGHMKDMLENNFDRDLSGHFVDRKSGKPVETAISSVEGAHIVGTGYLFDRMTKVDFEYYLFSESGELRIYLDDRIKIVLYYQSGDENNKSTMLVSEDSPVGWTWMSADPDSSNVPKIVAIMKQHIYEPTMVTNFIFSRTDTDSWWDRVDIADCDSSKEKMLCDTQKTLVFDEKNSLALTCPK